MIKKLENTMVVSVVSPSGEEVETRELHNVPMMELFPNEPVVIVDWLTTGKPPTVEELLVPVLANGYEFYGHLGWGSAVKRGQTIGLRSDLLVDIGLLKTAERGIMTGRMLLNQGLYGGLVGKFGVKVVEPGTIIEGSPIEDGYGLIRRDLAEMGSSNHDPILLGQARQADAFWQRVTWSEELEAELKPLIDQTLIDLASGEGVLWLRHKGAQWDERKKLVALDARMGEHPYVAFALSRSSASDLARAATTVDVPARVRIAVPTAMPKATAQGRNVLVRYPIDSNGSMQAVRCNPRLAEVERVAKLEVIQYTLASLDVMAKGCLGVVDELPEGVDLVLCSKDVKMGHLRKGANVVDGVVAFNQWFASGCAIGVNAEWSKDRMGLDFDGDLVFVYDCSDLPVLWQAVADQTQGETPKLDKTHSKLTLRPQMIVQSMRNIVGFAHNLSASTFAVVDRKALAKGMGFQSEAALDTRLTYLMKVGTDMFKVMVNTKAVEKQLAIMQTNLRKLVGKMAPWTRWPNEAAFRRMIPEFCRKGMDKREQREAVPQHFDGTVAQILRHTLPSIGAALETPIKSRPLSAFTRWAPRVSTELLKTAHGLQMEFNARVRAVNFTDPERIQEFHAWWRGAIEEERQASGATRWEACAALWREAHSARSQNSSGASVFMGFPQLCQWIVGEKPGKREAGQEVLVVGLNYQFDKPPSKLTCKVEIVEHPQMKHNKCIIRKVLLANVDGQHDARGSWPRRMLGVVEVHSLQPEVGEYVAHLTKAGHGRAWHCQLSRA